MVDGVGVQGRSIAERSLPLDQAFELDSIERDNRPGAPDRVERHNVAKALSYQVGAGGERSAANTGVTMNQHW